jgi:Na+/proline symporter
VLGGLLFHGLETEFIMSDIERLLTAGLLFLGLLLFVRIAWTRRQESFRLRNFFQGGGSIGPELTEHNSIGLTFAWMGGIWFFTTISYSSGPWVVLLQLPWCVSVILLAILFRKIKKVIGLKTIHGFLGESYSPFTQLTAAISTAIGYLINCGFEILWSSLMLSHCLGAPESTLSIAIVLATVAAIYCMIGGYLANSKTDRHQNVLGVIALACLVCFVVLDTKVPSVLMISAGVFVLGSVFYAIFTYSVGFLKPDSSQKIQNLTAIIFAVIALSVCFAMTFTAESSTSLSAPSLRSSALPIPLLVGLLSFQLIFNAIDMANWQQVAANSEGSDDNDRKVKRAIIRSAMYLLWFPALGGTILGCALRFAETPAQNETIFAIAYGHVLPGAGEVVRGLILGIITLGLISTTLSTADSYLMSAVQTITTDILFRTEYNDLVKNSCPKNEKQFVIKCRNFLIPIALLAVGLAYGLWVAYPSAPLDFQSLMYAWALTLAAPVIVALLLPAKAAGKSQHATAGIGGAIICVTAMFFFAVFALPADSSLRTWLVNLMPSTALLVPAISMSFPTNWLPRR